MRGDAPADDESELDDLIMAAPGSVGEGTIIAFPDLSSLDVQFETAADVKERPWMRVDPTAPGTRQGDEDLAFPFAYRQGVYVAMSTKNPGGEAIEVPPTAFDRSARTQAQTNFQMSDEQTYAVPWTWATIDNSEARPIIGRADVGTVKRVRAGIARVLKGTMGPGDLGRGV